MSLLQGNDLYLHHNIGLTGLVGKHPEDLRDLLGLVWVVSSGGKGQCRGCRALGVWYLVACLCTLRILVDFSSPAGILVSAHPLSVTPFSWEGNLPEHARDLCLALCTAAALWPPMGDAHHPLNRGWRKCCRTVLKGAPWCDQALGP